MAQGHWLIARDKPGLLIAMMRTLVGQAHISFEGDLAHCYFAHLAQYAGDAAFGLRRTTPYPRLDFVVLPLEPDTIRPILDQVLPDARAVHDIIHIQIEKNGQQEFGAYDNFHPECIACGPFVSQNLLDDLLHRGVLRAYLPLEDDQALY